MPGPLCVTVVVVAFADPILGRTDRSAWRGFHVKGNLLAARARYVGETWGAPAVAAVAGQLAPDVRAAFDAPVLPFAWYPFTTMAEIDRAIVDGPMAGQVARMKHFGSTIARYDLPTLYKVLFKIGSPGFILGRLAVVYSTYLRGGALSALSVEKGRARLALTEGDLPYYFCDQGVPGWITAAVELSGGKNVDAAQVSCVHRGDARCEWRCLWG
jgi:hypothetical protein